MENSRKWSWGGAMFGLMYLALAKKYLWAVLAMIGMFIPFANIVVILLLFFLGGFKGTSWLDGVPHKDVYTNFFERIWLFVFILFVIGLVVSIVGMIVGFSLGWPELLGGMESFGSYGY